MKHIRIHFIFTLIIIISFGLFMSCTSYRLKKTLNEYELEELTLMKYFSSRSEYMGYLKADPEKRQEYLEDFWKMYDPDIETKRNDFYIDVKRRFKYADKKYKEQKTPGHLTARGRIYIMFGPPDDVIPGRYSPPIEETRGVNREYFTETWTYSYPERLEFLFVDELGVGVYSQYKSSHVSNDPVTSNLTPMPDVKKPPFRIRTWDEVQRLKKERYFK